MKRVLVATVTTVIMVATSLAFLASCATMELVTETESPAIEAVNQLDSIGVTLMRMRVRGMMDIVFDKGNAPYYAQREDPGFGTYGIVEHNVFSDIMSVAQRSSVDFQRHAQETWIAYLTGQKEYTYDYGSLRGGVGSVTNVTPDGTILGVTQQIDPVDVVVASYLIAPRQTEAAIDEAVAAYDGDAFLAGTIDMSIGVIHALMPTDRRLRPDYFYLYSETYAEWFMHDADSGEPLFDSTESPIEYPQIELGFFVELPVDPGDFDGLDRLLRSREFDQYIEMAIDDAISHQIYKLAPYEREYLQRVEE